MTFDEVQKLLKRHGYPLTSHFQLAPEFYGNWQCRAQVSHTRFSLGFGPTLDQAASALWKAVEKLPKRG